MSWFARPKNALISLMLLGRWYSVMAFSLSASGCIPLSLISYPANFISVPMSSFFLLMVIFSSLHLVSIILMVAINSSNVSAHTRMSSTIFSAFCMPVMTLSDLMHHSSPEGASPMGALLYLNLP